MRLAVSRSTLRRGRSYFLLAKPAEEIVSNEWDEEMKRSGLPKYVTWVHVNGKSYSRARKNGKEHYFKTHPGTEEFATEYHKWLPGHDREPRGRGTKARKRLGPDCQVLPFWGVGGPF